MMGPRAQQHGVAEYHKDHQNTQNKVDSLNYPLL